MKASAPVVERIEMVIANRVEELSRVAACLDDLCVRRRLPKDAVDDMNLVLDEVLANVVSHAYGDDRHHEIRIVLTLFAGALQAEVVDDGRPFDPLAVAPQNRAVPLAEREVGGLGIHFMRSLMSELSYRRVGGRNRLLLTRNFT